MKIGKAKYGGGKKTYFKLKDGDVVYRILPPLGDLADEGFWSVYYRVHYGYKNAEGRSRPFESSLVKNRKNNMVEVADAAVERLDQLKSKLQTAKDAKDKKSVESLHKLVGAPKSLYNLDNNHYLNAIDLQGNIGILKLRHKAKQALDVEIRKLRDKGVDPLSVDNGRFFVFTRTGMGNETQFAVRPYKKTITIENVGEVEQDVVHKITEEVMARLSSEAAELGKLFRKPSEEEVAQIVAESNIVTGISPNIDDILGYKTNGGAAVDAEGDSNVEETDAAPEQAAAPEEVKAKPAAKPAPMVETKTEAKKAATAPQTTAEKVTEMSNDEFLKSLGLE